MTDNRKPIQTHTIQVEPGHRVDEVTLSPSSDRVLLRLYTSLPQSSVQRFLERLGVLRRNLKSGRDEIWVSDLDGRSRRLVGSLAVRPHGLGYESWVPMVVRWLPDGKRISFVLDSALYVVNVE